MELASWSFRKAWGPEAWGPKGKVLDELKFRAAMDLGPFGPMFLVVINICALHPFPLIFTPHRESQSARI